MNSVVTNEDCMELMKRYPDKYFDLAIVDPPYFTGHEKKLFYGAKESSLGVKRLYKPTTTWEKVTEKYFNEIQRVARNYIFFGANYYKFDFNSGMIVWDKCNDSSDYSDCELAATSLFKHTRIFRFMWNGMLQGESMSNGTKMQGNKQKNEKRIHPTQKPVALYLWILTKYGRHNDKILDTHLGSGSSRIACDKLDFDFTGCEINKQYFDDQEKRWSIYKSQLKLF